jgi:hypothetical protein
MFGVTKTMVGTRAFLVDNYAAGQEFHPFMEPENPSSCSEKPFVGTHTKQADSDEHLQALILQEPFYQHVFTYFNSASLRFGLQVF